MCDSLRKALTQRGLLIGWCELAFVEGKYDGRAEFAIFLYKPALPN